jgi:hypothetical protein
LSLKILKKVFYIINSLENKKLNFFFCKLIPKIKTQNLNKFDFIVFRGDKGICFIINLVFFLIKKKIKFEKNFFFIYKKKNIYYCQNIFVSLPKLNINRFFFFSFYYYLCNLFFILYLKKSIKFFLIKLSKNEITN